VAVKFVLNVVNAALDGSLRFPERIDDPADDREDTNKREQKNNSENPGSDMEHLRDEVFQVVCCLS
jgi:hypothetical protein